MLFYLYDEAPESAIGLFGDTDEVCNCLDEYLIRFSYWSNFHGGHRLTEDIIKNTLLPVINWMKIRTIHRVETIYRLKM